MQYQLDDGWTSVSFVRPAHWLVALHGDEVVAGPCARPRRRPDDARPSLRRPPRADRRARRRRATRAQLRDEGAVIAGFAERRAEIERQLDAAAARGARSRRSTTMRLLDEVTTLVEWPNVLTCRFDREFLAVPPECLVLTMKANQKYFPLLDADGSLTEPLSRRRQRRAGRSRAHRRGQRARRRGRAWPTPSSSSTRTGRRTLESRVAGLDRVVYHGKLGSQGDRVRRVRRIAAWIAARIGADAARRRSRRAARQGRPR